MTTIEWTDETWNPTDGCSVCSPGCANCYAMRFAGRFSKPGERYHGLVTIGKNKRAVWTGVLRLDSGKLAKPLHWKRPRKVFVNSMSDLFHEGLSNEQIAAVFGVMAACPHTFQVLTKRARRMREWFEWIDGESERGRSRGEVIACAVRQAIGPASWVLAMATVVDGSHAGWVTPARWPLPNVWLGVSVENQTAADERIPDLLATPAAVRFLSCEPLLGPVDLNHVQHNREFEVDALRGTHGVYRPHAGTCQRLLWVIAGCESGPGARTCSVRWLRALRDQCAAAGIAFFLKQAHEEMEPLRSDGSHEDEPPCSVGGGPGSKRKAGGVIGLPYLDGKQHAEFPK